MNDVHIAILMVIVGQFLNILDSLINSRIYRINDYGFAFC